MHYTFYAYKPDSADVCRGCSMAETRTYRPDGLDNPPSLNRGDAVGCSRTSKGEGSMQVDDMVLVRFGAFGTQLARIVGFRKSGDPIVFKWRANSRRWTKGITLTPRSIIRKASKDDLRAFKFAV